MEDMKAKIKEYISKQCENSSDSGATDKVMQCLNDTFQSAKDEWNKTIQEHKPPAFFEQFCSAKNNCVAQYVLLWSLEVQSILHPLVPG